VLSFTKGTDGFGFIQSMRKSDMAVVKLGFDTVWVAHNHLYPAGYSLLDRVWPGRSPRRSAGGKHLAQRKQAATPPAALGSHDRMATEIGY
jgi:hypothetical protein